MTANRASVPDDRGCTTGSRKGPEKKKKKGKMEESVNEHAGCLEEASGAISQWAVSGLILGFKKKEAKLFGAVY